MRKIAQPRSPSARPASIWLAGTDCSPARMISVTYAPASRPRQARPARKSLMRSGRASTAATMSWTIVGAPRSARSMPSVGMTWLETKK